MVDPSYYSDLLRPIFEGRRVVVFGLVLAGATGVVKRLRGLGAHRCLVVAGGFGTGDSPSPEDAECFVLDLRTDDIVAEMHAWEGIAVRPPPSLLPALDRYDPDRRALVLAPPVSLGPLPEKLAGRPFWGRRRASSLALEDKSRIDQFWDATGIRRAPSLIAPLNLDAVRGASERMDLGAGTVWAGDAREGIHGGAHMIRWVRTLGDVTNALEFFSSRCDRVRVMPFLEGIPCSIHGIVFADHVAAIRPVEMVTLRPQAQPRFLYSGAATYWDPPTADREEMQSIARIAGAAFRRIVGPGTFTIDGVMTDEGFLPTEMNARFGAGLNVIASRLTELPLALLTQALQQGEALDYRPEALEVLLVEGADRDRGGGGWTVFRGRKETSQSYRLVEENGEYRLAGAGETASADLLIGPSSVGGFLRFTPEPSGLPVGPSIAPRVVAAFALADREFGTGLGPLAPARDVRN